MKRTLFLLLTSLLLVAETGAGAATVSLHPNGNLVVLEGRIDVGDFDKVEKLSREATPTGIYLASPGGNLVEAIRIGALVRRLAWETRSAEGPDVAPAIRAGVATSYGVRHQRNNVCASACFFIFVAGIYRDGHALGIHQPFMSAEELARIPAEEATRRTNGVKALVERFFRKMGVPLHYVDEMYAVPKDQLRWLTEDEILADFHGFVPSVREWVRTQCGEDAETVRCKESVMMGIRIRAMQEAAR
ncbi:MAG: hypothetical protein M3Y67_03545 [Pseudomonadota bacterium]|nr:hypothetical protein [Pseudomonadota bacterium]